MPGMADLTLKMKKIDPEAGVEPLELPSLVILARGFLGTGLRVQGRVWTVVPTHTCANVTVLPNQAGASACGMYTAQPAH